MAYEKQNFVKGMVLTAEHLNTMDSEIEKSSKALETGYLNDDINTIEIQWENGAINTTTGENSEDSGLKTKRLRTNFIWAENGFEANIVNDIIEFCPCYYDEEKRFISSPGSYQSTNLTLSPKEVKYVRIMARAKPDSNKVVDPTYATNIEIVANSGVKIFYTPQEIDERLGKGLQGKKIIFLGDSIPHGQSYAGDIPIPYPKVVADNLGMTLINYGIGGSTIAQKDNYGGAFKTKAEFDAASKNTGKIYDVIDGQSYTTYAYSGGWNTTSEVSRTPLTARYQFMDNDAEIICVHCGTNDFQYNWTSLGDITSTSVNTFYGALKTLIEGLINKYQKKTIIFLTPLKRAQSPYTTSDSANNNGKTLKDYRNIIINVCEEYGIPIIDTWAISGLNPYLASQASLFDSVKTHPLQEGHKKLGDLVASQINSFKNFITK